MKNRHYVCPKERTQATYNPVKKIRCNLIKTLTISKIKTIRNFTGQIDEVLQKINCKKQEGMEGICSLKET